jgi:hypothetical protein
MNLASGFRNPPGPGGTGTRFLVFPLLWVLAGCGGGVPADTGSASPEVAEEVLVSAQLVGMVTRAGAEEQAREMGVAAEFPAVADAEIYRVRYRTTDLDGTPTEASGAVWIPIGLNQSLPLATYLHGTTFPRDEVPSNPRNQEGRIVGMLFANSGMVLAMPDYLGMGVHEGVHPWHHAESTASASLDMLRAAQELVARQGIRLDGRLFIFGYSQGGHAAMALHRELESQGLDGLRVTASAPMAGAYDLVGSARWMLGSNPAHSPVVLYAGYLAAVFNHIYEFSHVESILVPPFDELGRELLAGNAPPERLMRQAPERPRGIFQPAFLDVLEADPQNPFWSALEENSVYDWAPAAPTRLFHASGDQDVPIQNAHTAARRMRELGADAAVVDLGERFTHGTAAVPAMAAARSWFDTMR